MDFNSDGASVCSSESFGSGDGCPLSSISPVSYKQTIIVYSYIQMFVKTGDVWLLTSASAVFSLFQVFSKLFVFSYRICWFLGF